MSNKHFAIRCKKIITVSKKGTINDGVIIIEDGIIKEIGTYDEIKEKLQDITILNYKDKIITPSLIDCHTHLLEYASRALYPLTKYTYLYGGKSLLLTALINGITAIGEQICGNPICYISIDDYMDVSKDSPIRIKFSLNNITIGTLDFPHYCSASGNIPVEKNYLTNNNILTLLANKNQFPGENVFINASPANLPLSLVPRAGEIVFSKEELQSIVNVYHNNGSLIGAHVAGEEAIQLALDCGVDVLHHAHGITSKQVLKAKEQSVSIVITPLGGSHLSPTVNEDILELANSSINISIATDAYLPPSSNLDLDIDKLYGPEVLLYISKPILKYLYQKGFDENYCLSLLTANPAKILGLDHIIGKLEVGMEGDFLVCNGIPGLEVDNCEDISCVFIRGKKVISR